MHRSQHEAEGDCECVDRPPSKRIPSNGTVTTIEDQWDCLMEVADAYGLYEAAMERVPEALVRSGRGVSRQELPSPTVKRPLVPW